MKNVFRVLKRDIRRIVTTPAALAVVLFLILLPSVYTLYNVAGFWNPYDNTGGLHVCIVNQDEGATSDLTGDLNVGSQIVEQLQQNDQLDWHFTDFDTAMDELERGESYAIYLIPADFSKSLLTVLGSNYQQPVIHYYVNEKLGPVAPKVTDVGATALDESINANFVASVTDAVVDKLDDALSRADNAIDSARTSAVSKMNDALHAIVDARTSIGNVGAATSTAQGRIEAVRSDLVAAQADADNAYAALDDINARIAEIQKFLDSLTDASSPAISAATAAVGSLAATTVDASAQAAAAASEAQGAVRSALAQIQGVVDQNNDIIDALEIVYDSLPDDNPQREALAQNIADLRAKNGELQAVATEMAALESQSTALLDEASASIADLSSAMGSATEELTDYSRELYATSLPVVHKLLARLSAINGSLMSFVSNQSLMARQMVALLDQLDGTLGTGQSALSATDSLLGTMAGDLNTVRNDILSLARSNLIASLTGGSDLNPDRIAAFMESPTLLVTEQLYPVESYGAAMAPLFMNLTCWIGAFMLLVVFRQEVDEEGIKKLTLTQRYVSRFLLFGVLAILQALVCVAGVVSMGVTPVSIPALAVAAALTSLTYLSIVYALSVTFQHVGKGMCLLLVFAQIPGATGLYPIETTPPFFQALYPFLPFTYGIGAMREALCGFYGNQYAFYLGVLSVFLLLGLIFGIAMRRPMANVNRMFAEEIHKSGIYNIDATDIPLRPYRITQIIQALSNKEEYRRELVERYRKFMELRPRLIRWAAVVAIVLPVVLTIVFSLNAAEKVVLLSSWVVLFVAMVVAITVVEGFRYSLERQMQMDRVSDAELIKLGAQNDDVESIHVKAGEEHA